MIVGISGKIGTGKSTLARHFMGIVGGWRRVAFAVALKRECADRLDFPLEWTATEPGKARVVRVHPSHLSWLGMSGDEPVAVTVREILQRRGHRARSGDSLYWVRHFQLATRNMTRVICDDVRYPSEADYIRRAGGFLVRLQPYAKWRPGPYADHESEKALDNYRGWDLTLAPAYGELHQAAELLADLVVGLMDTTP